MATISREEIVGALERLGQLAETENEQIELLLVGGALMVLEFGTREATRDVDAVTVLPEEAHRVRKWAETVAAELGWPADWLNDGAKGFLVGTSAGPVVLSAPGIRVRRPSVAQLLAMKLCAWRDDVDIADASRLLQEASPGKSMDEVFAMVSPHLVPGSELKAQYALADLWESAHGDD